MTYVAYETIRDNAIIHQWHRPTPNGERVHTKVDFDPYYLTSEIPVEHPRIAEIRESAMKPYVGHKQLYQVITKLPEDVREVRQRTEDNYEDDLVFVSRYLVDTYLNKEYPTHHNQRFSFDIESNNRRPLSQHMSGHAEVLSFGFIPNDGKLWVYLLSPPNYYLKPTAPKQNYRIYLALINRYVHVKVFNSEKFMFEKFFDRIVKCDPDLFVHWHGDGYDFPTIISRARTLGVDYKRISPIRQVKVRDKIDKSTGQRVDKEIQIAGRTSFDGLKAYRKMMIMQGQVRRYSLDDVSRDENLKHQKLHKSKSVVELWESSERKDILELIAYNIQDVLATNEIVDKYNLIDHHEEMKKFCRCQIKDTFYNTRMIDNLLIHRSKQRGIALPSRSKGKTDRSKGAVVLDPEIGRHEWVLGLDIAGMYPSNIMSLNLSPDTYTDNPDPTRPYVTMYLPEKDQKLNFYLDTVGLMPYVLHGMNVVRKDITNLMKMSAKGSNTHKSLDLQQYAVKVAMNSVYGALGFSTFRMMSIPVADATTLLGRITIDWLKEEAPKFLKMLQDMYPEDEILDIIALYGDTDSCYVKLVFGKPPRPEVIADAGYLLAKELNKTFDEMLKTYVTYHDPISNTEVPFDVYHETYQNYFENVRLQKGQMHRLSLEFESVFRRLVFMEAKSGKGAKKRYFGLKIWGNKIKGGWYKVENGVPVIEDGETEIKGLERSDNSIFGVELVSNVIEKVLKLADANDIHYYLEEQNADFLGEDEHNIAIYVPLNKSPQAYTNRPSKRGFVNMSKYLGTMPQIGERYAMWYVSDTPTGIPPRDVICSGEWENVPHGWIIDYDKHWDSIRNVLSPILTPLGLPEAGKGSEGVI